MVAHLHKQHGPIWVSEDCAYQTYPPPSLEALLKLVLLPNIDMVSVQAIVSCLFLFQYFHGFVNRLKCYLLIKIYATHNKGYICLYISNGNI